MAKSLERNPFRLNVVSAFSSEAATNKAAAVMATAIAEIADLNFFFGLICFMGAKCVAAGIPVMGSRPHGTKVVSPFISLFVESNALYENLMLKIQGDGLKPQGETVKVKERVAISGSDRTVQSDFRIKIEEPMFSRLVE